MGSGVATAKPALKVHKDSLAGVKFTIPFREAKVYDADAMRRMMERAQKGAPPDGVMYTSGVYSRGGVPYIAVWTQQNERPVSRELADHFASGGAGRSLAAMGLRDFVFSRDRLAGEGRLEAAGDLKVKILLALLKDHITYVGFHYRDPADLKMLDVVRASLAPSRRQALRYAKLPKSAQLLKAERGISWYLQVVVLGLAALVIGFVASVFYRVMKQREDG